MNYCRSLQNYRIMAPYSKYSCSIICLRYTSTDPANRLGLYISPLNAPKERACISLIPCEDIAVACGSAVFCPDFKVVWASATSYSVTDCGRCASLAGFPGIGSCAGARGPGGTGKKTKKRNKKQQQEHYWW